MEQLVNPNMAEVKSFTSPDTGVGSFAQNWRHDLIAAVSVALVALPLGLGISIASGSTVPPMAGVISAIIGGLITTFIRGSHVGINGPGAGLIGVSLAGVVALNDPGYGNGWEYYLAAVVLAGVMQAAMGLFKWGKYGDLLPSSVVRGVLAAIGIIIFASQIHIAFDTGVGKVPALESIKMIPSNLKNINWPIAIIAINSLAILILHPMFINKLRLLHYIPAPMLVLLVAVPFVYLFDMEVDQFVHLFGKDYRVGPDNLIHVDNIVDSFNYHPNFGKIGTSTFWAVTISIFLVSTMETLPSAKAVDKLDPYKRVTNLNKDLVGTGLSTVLAGFVGGLPVITVIVRSSLNINHGARTKWSNFFHGLILLAIVFFLIEPIQKVPLAALAAILVYTGITLASPKMFRDTLKMGYEQIVIVAFTIISTLQFDLKTGLLGGVLITLLIHLVKSHIPINLFFKYLRNPQYQVGKDDGKNVLKVRGISSFTNLLQLTDQLERIGFGKAVIVDFSGARLVDHTVLETLKDWDDKNANAGGSFEIVGLDSHITTSDHPLSLHVLPPKATLFLSKRQQALKEIAAEYKWTFDPTVNWTKGQLRKFDAFQSRPIEYSKNKLEGTFSEPHIDWSVQDVTFDEGAFLVTEVHHTTVIIVKLAGYNLPQFEIEKEGWFTRLLDLAKREEIVFDDRKFTLDFAVKGQDQELVKEFFNAEIVAYLTENKRYHIEGNAYGLLIFKSFRFASQTEVYEMIKFTEGLVEVITRTWKK